MKYILFFTLIAFCLCNSICITAQNEDGLSRDIALGMAELRADIFKRNEVYVKHIKEIITSLDSSSLSDIDKKIIHDYIQQDLKAGAISNSLELYDLLPQSSPYRNIYIERYIANNQDYQIDKDLIFELTRAEILTTGKRINGSKIEELIKDFDFLDIKVNDRVLFYNAWGAEYALLIGYCFEGIDLTIHNQYLDNHYTALDRIDRYPDINNGNLIEFLHNEDSRVMVEGERWNKIIIRDPRFLEQSPGFTLNSLHDNLTEDGHLYLLHSVRSDKKECQGYLKEENILKISKRTDFEIIGKLKMDCLTYYKLKSSKVIK